MFWDCHIPSFYGKIRKIRNPNIEIRNNIKSSKYKNSKHFEYSKIYVLFRISCFDIRILIPYAWPFKYQQTF